MTVALEVLPTAEAASRRVAALVAERVAASPGPFALALSRSRPGLLRALADEDVPWERVTVFQVDERVAPGGSPERNLTGLLEALPQAGLRPMPVEDPDLEAAARRYEAELPEALDLVHLGLGGDGHTASLVPGDPVLEVRDRDVVVTGEYRGRRRMTLTYPALDRAREIVWLVAGEEKREALRQLLDRDPSIPASHVAAPVQLVVADHAAAASPSR
ncbi:MAG TPA: 6-phosphogluconolactonase [Gaiellaceae bacterium]|nr:6-phosphogluconolactonase [Gaiellaceae bacterium]